ncbi:hypothetical protein [Paraflavitalea sp. CAU 1676]|uniref:hypothetical protein n=1 Tax=Paraflavitalea sp. CAU 1676 TaxID=3032598 RepID=UPI0023DB06E7|nr:hypothetical protein [Paraflavitalea sp. CAU 1676]MDF2193206.1 hypothetical protein [Paraflavitalea sp. CAU 1676]
MTQDQLSRLLENLTARLQPAAPQQEQQLKRAQELIASSVIKGDIPYAGEQVVFNSAQLFAAADVTRASLDQIKAIATETVAANKDPETRFFIRQTPVRQYEVAGSVPDWAVGSNPVESLGPFLNEQGIEIWIDFYKIVKLVTLYMNGAPAILFKTTVRGIPIGINTPPPLLQQYTLNAGSIWINARLLSPAAPNNKYVGLKIKDGTLNTSIAPVLQNNQAVLNPATVLTLALDIEQPTENFAGDGSGYGDDARKATYQLPTSLQLVWQNNKVDITGIGEAGCTVFGQALSFANTNQAAISLEYNALMSKVLIPWNASPVDFVVTDSVSPAFKLSGQATITQAYWGLPAAALDVANPVQADSGGSVVLVTGKGLIATWPGLQYESLRLQATIINAEPGMVALLDLAAQGLGAMQYFDLWKEGQRPASTATITYLQAAPFMLAISAEQNQEMITIFADADIQADRPLKVNSSPFAIRSRASALALMANKDRRLIMLFDDNLLWDNKKPEDKQPLFKWEAIALENALFTVSPVAGFMLFGELSDSWKKVTRANFFLVFGLSTYLPTLPDPYVGNFGLWIRRFAKQRVAGNDAGLAATGSLQQLQTMLVCAIRYAKGAAGDDVTTDFYFGTVPPAWTELPEEQPAQPVQPAQPGKPKPVQPVREGGGLTPGGGVHVIRRPVLVDLTLKAVRLMEGARLVQFKNATRIKVSDLLTERVVKHAVSDLFIPKKKLPQLPATKTVLDTVAEGEELKHKRLALRQTNDYTGFWDNDIIGSGLDNDVFALLDVSSNAHQMGISINPTMLFVQTGTVVPGVAGDHAVNMASTRVAANNAFPFVVEGMQVKSPSRLVKSFTLPQIAWEPVINLTAPDREPPGGPKLAMDPEAGFIYFANDGGATRLWNNSTQLVALAPIPVVDALIKDFKENTANYTVASFTMPFGLKAISYVSKNFVEPVKPDITNLRPLFRKQEDGSHKLEGGIQIQFTAGQFGKPVPTPAEKDSPMFPGYTIQLNNLLDMVGIAKGESNLGHRVTEIFNNEFLVQPLGTPGLEKSRGVPLTRMDVTGYGANIFSKWLSPTAAIAQTSQARFDVMLGRTAHEVIQVKSILYPWGIRVVRTITVFRTSTGYVYRVDSGWKAESDGLFDFSYRYLLLGKDPFADDLKDSDFKTVKAPYDIHPGIVRGLFNIRNIKDAASVAEFTDSNFYPGGLPYVNGVKGMEMMADPGGITEPVKCGAVYFDADVEIENVVQGHTNKRVVSKKILGYVQVAPAGVPLTPLQLRGLLDLHGGSIGGDLDCVIDIAQSNQQMKLTRFDCNVSIDGSKPVFVLAGRGQVILPKDGSWTMVQHEVGTGDVAPLAAGTTVPLIRKGLWQKETVVNQTDVEQQLLRIAHPKEIIREATSDTINFGFLQSTATQKALFLTPAFGFMKKQLLSKTPPIFADAYRLMTGNGIFPNVGNAIDNFGKAMPLFHGKRPDDSLFDAFNTSALKDGLTNVLELMEITPVKAGEVIVEQGMSLLQKGAAGVLDKAMKFDVPPFEIPLVDTDGLRIYIEYAAKKKDKDPKGDAARLNFDVTSLANDLGDQWKSRLNNLAMVVDLGDMKRLMIIKGNFDSKKGKETGYEGDQGGDGWPTPEIEFSDALKPVIDILQVLAKLSSGDYAAAMKKGLQIAMSNSGEIWEYKFEAGKEIPLVRFPPTDELYNSAQTPLKLEASLGIGVYFNAALKVTTDPKQLLPTAGAYIKFHGGLKVMCMSVGVGSIFAIGTVDVKVACDTKVGPSLALDFGFGIEIVVSLPVVGNASVSYLVGVQMYADKNKVIVAALMRFRGHAELLGGLVAVTITIEAKGIIVRENEQTDCSAQVTFAIDISIFLIIDISFSKTWGEDRQIA